MKRLNYSILTLLVFLTLLISIFAVNSYAQDGDATIYLTPNSNWRADDARFAMYTWDADGNYLWIDMSDSDGDGVYEGVLPTGYTDIIFCRMDPSKPNGWSDNKTWNQTNDLSFDGRNNHYTIAVGAWSKGEGRWSVFDADACVHSYENDFCTKCGEELIYIVAGNVMKDGGSYREGDNGTLFVSEWDISDENNRLFYDEASGCYLKMYENVAAGEYHFKVVENRSWDISYGNNGENCYLKVDEDGSTVIISFKDGRVTSAAMVIDSTDEVPDNDGQPDSSDGNSEVDELNFFEKIWRAIVDFFKALFGIK